MKIFLWRSLFALAFCFVAFPLWCCKWREWGSILGIGAWGALSMCWAEYMELADAHARRMIQNCGKRR